LDCSTYQVVNDNYEYEEREISEEEFCGFRRGSLVS
jgi:hypothetical protein